MAAFQMSRYDLTVASLLLQNLSFFAFGGSNAISSIDLSNAYNGVSGYNIGAVGILTFCTNWAGPLWWTSGIVMLWIQNSGEKPNKDWAQHLSILSAVVSTGVLCVMLACTALRTHLFIWTVFSPKYLYTIAWVIGQHLAANIGFGSLLFWIAFRNDAGSYSRQRMKLREATMDRHAP